MTRGAGGGSLKTENEPIGGRRSAKMRDRRPNVEDHTKDLGMIRKHLSPQLPASDWPPVPVLQRPPVPPRPVDFHHSRKGRQNLQDCHRPCRGARAISCVPYLATACKFPSDYGQKFLSSDQQRNELFRKIVSSDQRSSRLRVRTLLQRLPRISHRPLVKTFLPLI